MRGASTTEYIIIIAVALVIGVIAASLLGVFPVGANENAGAIDRSTGTPFGVVESNKIEGALKMQVVLQNNDGTPRSIRGVVAEADGKKYVTNYDPNIVFDAGSRQTLEIGVPDTLDGDTYSYGLTLLYDENSEQETDVEGDTAGGNGFGTGRDCTDSPQCAAGLICMPSAADGHTRCRIIAGYCNTNEECASLYCYFNMCTDRPPGTCSPICKAGSPASVCAESLEWCSADWEAAHPGCEISSSCNGEYAPCLPSCGGPACKDLDGGCMYDYECCGGVCDGYACSCKASGESCSLSEQCCAGFACDDVCLDCRQPGESCNGFDSDCCQEPAPQNCIFLPSPPGYYACFPCKPEGEPCSSEEERECCGSLSCDENGFCSQTQPDCAQNGGSCETLPCCQTPDRQTCWLIDWQMTCVLECGSGGDECGEDIIDCCPRLDCVETPEGNRCYPCSGEGEECAVAADCCQTSARQNCNFNERVGKRVCMLCKEKGMTCHMMTGGGRTCCGELVCRETCCIPDGSVEQCGAAEDCCSGNCNTITGICEAAVFCGDGACNGAETQANCCFDCGCQQGYECQPNDPSGTCQQTGCNSDEICDSPIENCGNCDDCACNQEEKCDAGSCVCDLDKTCNAGMAGCDTCDVQCACDTGYKCDDGGRGTCCRTSVTCDVSSPECKTCPDECSCQPGITWCEGGACVCQDIVESCDAGKPCCRDLTCSPTSRTCCIPDGSLEYPCGRDADCCSGNCNEALRICEAAPVCRESGQSCGVGSNCCDGLKCSTVNSKCVYCIVTPRTCSALGDLCCSPGVCTINACQGGPTCKPSGWRCSTMDPMCCAGLTCRSIGGVYQCSA